MRFPLITRILLLASTTYGAPRATCALSWFEGSVEKKGLIRPRPVSLVTAWTLLSAYMEENRGR